LRKFITSNGTELSVANGSWVSMVKEFSSS